MLSEPRFGWTHLELIDERGEKWSAPASYITSVPNDCLDAFIRYYESGKPQCVDFDAEGWSYILVIERYYCFVIIRKDEEELNTFEIKADDLCEDLIDDIEKDLGRWAAFDYALESEKDIKIAKRKLVQKLSHLKKMKSIVSKE